MHAPEFVEMSDPSLHSAVQRVFATPKLLESISVQLPFFDLLIRAPLVCHRFRDTISESVVLQQALFFAPKYDVLRLVPNLLVRYSKNHTLFTDKRFKLRVRPEILSVFLAKRSYVRSEAIR